MRAAGDLQELVRLHDQGLLRLGVAAGTVKSRTARALEALRRALDEDIDV